MKRKREKSIPLQLLREYMEAYPKVWKNLDESYEMAKEEWRQKKQINFWSQNIHTPKLLCQAALEFDYPNDYSKIQDPFRIATLAAWRSSKEVFVIDHDTERELLKTEYDGSIPSDVLQTLPFHCFYVQTNDVWYFGKKIDGFFVCHDFVGKNEDFCLHLLTTSGGEFYYDMIISLTEPTLDKNFEKILKESFDDYGMSKKSNEFGEWFKNESEKAFKNVLQIILYILAINSDVCENKRKVVKRSGKITDKATEIREWEVGVRIGAAFRKARKSEDGQSTTRSIVETVGIRKRPHIRRAHWHHYWTGKRDSEDRKMILKWLPPIAINTVDKNELPVVIHNVK